MTVRELRDWCDSYMRHGDGDGMLNDTELDRMAYEERCNREVMVVDDGMEPKYFAIESAVKTTFERMVKPAKVEKRKAIDRSRAFCTDCNNMVEGSAKTDSRFLCGARTVSCRNPRCGKVLTDVGEYVGSPCIDFSPKKPSYVEEDVQAEPPEYKTEPIAALIVNAR